MRLGLNRRNRNQQSPASVVVQPLRMVLQVGEVIGETVRLTGEGNGSANPLKPLVYYVRHVEHSLSLCLSTSLAHPHNTVSESSFFKHIDSDIPETERLRLLLIWCTSRAAHSYHSSNPDASLPPLSEQESTVLNKVHEDIQQMLADKKIDISPTSQPSGSSQQSRANDQNVSNRKYETRYSNEIQL